MSKFTITPKVDETQEFIEIANDFSNPLDLVREAISNSYDAGASKIEITFLVETHAGEKILRVDLFDDGQGMDLEGLQSFFDLGNSTKREIKGTIGEKGHGTKVFYNSKKIILETSNGLTAFRATLLEPFARLHERIIPIAEVEELPIEQTPRGTRISIWGYNNNRRDKFTHHILRDYIQWFTRHGAIGLAGENKVTLFLRGLGVDKAEKLSEGHFFPEPSKSIEKLLDEYMTKAPDFYCKRVEKSGQLKNSPEIKFSAIFSIEGKYVKYSYNEMLRRPGYSAPEGAYTVSDRYGLWLCKDGIPIQRKNEWITVKGSEYTKFHAFVNCQGLRLTANRGSIDNTPSEILQDLKDSIQAIYNEILESSDWTSIDWLESESFAYQTTEREKKNFEWRKKKIEKSNIATYNGLTLVEPERESGVFSLFLILKQAKSDLFPFEIIDYDTHEGIDVIAKGDKTTPIQSARLFYVEFKKTLSGSFNHSFENLHSIVCWDTDIKSDDIMKDINGEERRMKIISPDKETDYTRYFLDNPKKAIKIEVYVLKQYLREKLKIEFYPRPTTAVV